VTAADMHIVLDGPSSKVTDPGLLAIIADAYRAKYDWNVTVAGGEFDAPYGAPTAGPLFGFVNDSALGPSSTRCRF
jgi:hypothetical protein